ncbi:MULTISPECIES: heat-inducible transcriptional repressor HrcA [Cyanophyceae]|uniref:heat-inducible transcriptional repressor HrcA n=1 Tax=Cyanophyceae TaxID=3028117 RepID=UPI0016839A21|nr:MULTISPECIES: heat-inducible transcriptional repressor HrcA [Cyanophyceae]MBD1914926.1 heat-inducible transcriptional repressor HrcA [Phormidium sp. FACHB-77]MBD2028604.1 heat-inducible transcriptional repressor HrcA [Phormidium sp. FACHB-322]MBD2051752.1 heat-inducible transcriptional repressor HrcA [Leptolyngbya sp. FACHB-60]
MDPAPPLSARHEQVLQATIRHYIATAEPVGSRALAQEYNLRVSPATVRNTMGLLEKYGLLYQPHTSSGRVPSDFGYRLYVDRLMSPSARVGRRVDAALSEELHWMGRSLESLLKEATQILAQISGYLALVTVPQSNTVLIRHIQLVVVDGGQVLMVVLLDSLATQSVVVQLPAVLGSATLGAAEEPGRRDLEILSNFLTHHLRGRPLADVTTLNWGDLDAEFEHYGVLLCQALGDLAQRSQAAETPQLVISGLAEVLRQPEFSDAQRIQSIVRLLEEDQSQLWPLFFATPPVATQALKGVDVKVWIGAENPLEPMQGCALVVSNYTRHDTSVGSVGVLGPTRMVYENAVAVVKAAADYLSTALSE